MRAGVYLRISKDRERTELGVQRQREDCLRLCRERGWEPVEYVDNDISAYSGRRRPAYQKMLADIEAGAIQAVVVWDQDRLDKGGLEAEQFINLADRYGVALGSIGGDFDLSTDQGRLMYRVKGAVSRAEMERKSARQKRAALQAAEMGKPRGGPRAFGYEGDGLTIRPDEAEAIRNAYRSALSGGTLVSMCRDLNAAGFVTPAGNPFRHSGIRAILLNPRNAGLRAYRDEIVGSASWPAIVDEDTWRAVHAILTDDGRRTNHGTARKWLLGGLALCGRCDDATTVRVSYRERRAAGAPVRIYRCRTHPHLSREADYCDHVVTDVVTTRLSLPDAGDLLIDHGRPGAGRLRDKAEILRLRLDQLAEQFADGTLTGPQLRAGTERLRTRLADVEKQMAQTSRAPLLAALVKAQDTRAVWDGLSLDSQRAVIATLFTVTLLPRGPGRVKPTPESLRFGWL